VKKLILPVSLLVLIAVDVMSLDAIRSNNEGLIMYGWVALFFSVIVYAIMFLQFLSKEK